MARTKDPHAATVKAWETRKRGTVREREQRLNGPVSSVKELAGGISETYKVTLEDGTVGNFKLQGRHQVGGPETEVAAWEVAKLVGMEDMVPAASVREIDLGVQLRGSSGTHRGSFAEWQEGTPAIDVAVMQDPDASFIDSEVAFGDSEHDVMRAAMFDYIIGNQDRHPGNWVVDAGKVRLIDHNDALGEFPYSLFLDRVNRRPAMANKSVASYVKPYLDKLPHILAAVRAAAPGRLGASSLRPSEAMARWGATRAVALEARVGRAASATTWRDFLDGMGIKEQIPSGLPKPSGPHGFGRASS